MNKKILITGCAGFIGFSLINKISQNNKVYGIDNIQKKNSLKISKYRLKLLKKKKKF